MRWWGWWRRDGDGMAEKAAEAEAKLRAARRMTPHIERMADQVADLSAEEFADRVARAFRRRPA